MGTQPPTCFGAGVPMPILSICQPCLPETRDPRTLPWTQGKHKKNQGTPQGSCPPTSPVCPSFFFVLQCPKRKRNLGDRLYPYGMQLAEPDHVGRTSMGHNRKGGRKTAHHAQFLRCLLLSNNDGYNRSHTDCTGGTVRMPVRIVRGCPWSTTGVSVDLSTVCAISCGWSTPTGRTRTGPSTTTNTCGCTLRGAAPPCGSPGCSTAHASSVGGHAGSAGSSRTVRWRGGPSSWWTTAPTGGSCVTSPTGRNPRCWHTPTQNWICQSMPMADISCSSNRVWVPSREGEGGRVGWGEGERKRDVGWVGVEG